VDNPPPVASYSISTTTPLDFNPGEWFHVDMDNGATFYWKPPASIYSEYLYFGWSAPTTGWVGCGFTNPNYYGMVGSDAFFGSISSGATTLFTANLVSKDLNAKGVKPDKHLLIYEGAGSLVNGEVRFMAKRKLDQGINPILKYSGFLRCQVVISYSSYETEVSHKHSVRSDKGRYVDLMTGQVALVDKYAPPIRVAHGVLMGTAFVLLFPIGLMVARYAKSPTGTWFKIHFFLQNYAFIIMLTGIIIGYTLPVIQFMSFTAHAALGTTIFILTVFQMLSGYLRPHKGDPPSTFRLLFEFFHHWNGRILLFCTIAQIALGIKELGVNNFAYGIWLPFLLILFITSIVLEIRLCLNRSKESDKQPVYKLLM